MLNAEREGIRRALRELGWGDSYAHAHADEKSKQLPTWRAALTLYVTLALKPEGDDNV